MKKLYYFCLQSLMGNNQALFLVDGVPFNKANSQEFGYGGHHCGDAAADINPDNITSVDVLKRTAAMGLYGSWAGDGVIMTKNRRGFDKKGSKNRGLGVAINAGVTIGKTNKSTFVNYQREYGTGYGLSTIGAFIGGDKVSTKLFWDKI